MVSAFVVRLAVVVLGAYSVQYITETEFNKKRTKKKYRNRGCVYHIDVFIWS